ncbi:MAG TPA: methyltransferase domain-containing protein [Pirellulales bacterium]|nr:methyltransferase domain-containing protein [Pirellulales bacterium]
MTVPEAEPDRGDLSAASDQPPSKRSLGPWPLLGLLGIAAAASALVFFKYQAVKPSYEPAPPRPLVNAPYISTSAEVVDRMLELASLGPDDVVYDLGCGDGRILVTAAKRYGCRSFGYDINPERVAEARENARQNGVEELVEIGQRDILTLDLSKATVVTMYLLPRLNKELIPQLDKLRPGARVVSHAFEIEGLVPDRRVEVLNDEGQLETMLYLFTAPLKHRPSK